MINLNAMDMGLSIGFFASFALFGSLDYATIFNLTPFMNETVITIIALLLLTGAMAKSAQIPLHSWLPGSMEGFKGTDYIFIILVLSCLYHIDNNTNICLSSLPLILNTIPTNVLHIITGNMLGDGHINVYKSKSIKINRKAKYCMTMDTFSLNYLMFLYDNVYKQFNPSKLYPYPNINLPKHAGKEIKQYYFYTQSLPLFYYLHNLWYKWDDNKQIFIKIIPSNIAEIFSAISLAY